MVPIFKETGPYIAMFAAGFPHYVEPSKQPRLSIVIRPKLKHDKTTCLKCKRGNRRLELLRKAVAGDTKAIDTLLGMTEQIGMGAPHMHPESEFFC